MEITSKLTLHSPYKPDNDKLFHIVIPTFNGGYKLEVIINCLLAQTCQDFHMSVISDGYEATTYSQLEKYFGVSNFSYFSTDKRYNDYGHTPRELGMRSSDCKYTIMTGFDNYYVPIFIERFEQACSAANNVGFIFCDFILDHIRDGRRYSKYIDSKLEVNYIDIGNFAAETQFIKQAGIKVNEYAADWHLVNDLIPLLKSSAREIIKIPQTLYVHN
jgi:glycosyltransferase involved in cell wall biosynthesis